LSYAPAWSPECLQGRQVNVRKTGRAVKLKIP